MKRFISILFYFFLILNKIGFYIYMFEIIHFGTPQSLQLASSTLTCHIHFSMPYPLYHVTSISVCHVLLDKQSHIYITSSCSISFTYPHPLQNASSTLTYHIHFSLQHLNSIQIPFSIATEKLSLCLCNLMV